MKKLTVALFLGGMVFLPSISKAQAFEQGKSNVSIGQGTENITQKLIKASSSNASFSVLGPMFVKYEYGVSEHIGYGLNLAYASAGYTYDDGSGSYSWTGISSNARLNYHFGSHEKFDPYWGVGMGYKTAIWQSTLTDPDSEPVMGALIPLGFETTFGARYMVTKNIGFYGEVGISKAIAQFGINAKF